ncbi:fungal-specific transcription factor domain-containing protein [Aspergillus egyptiacus]|nr:fungal-specific transcription factor domain-containing protein [Aspergillus egyptiacus]
MKKVADSSNNVKSHQQPVRGLLSVPSALDSRGVGRDSVTTQRRKRTNGKDRLEETRGSIDQQNKKRCRMADDPNGYRRQRNLKNLMLIDRLETNIGRMEEHLKDLGFDLNLIESAQASPPRVMSDNAQSPPPSPSIAESEHLVPEEAWDREPYYEADHGRSRSFLDGSLPYFDGEPTVSEAHQDSEASFLDDCGGFPIPRCLFDFAASASLPALSREGLEWIGRKSGINPRLSSGNPYKATACEAARNDFPRKVFCPLPSKEEASSLLHEYLQNFNSLCPLFQQDQLASIFNHDRLEVAVQESAYWACANVVLALGIAFRIKDGSIAQSEHQRSWLFIKNALGAFHDLCLGQPSVWSVQALLGMSIFFLGTMSAEPCSLLVTAAIRMMRQIGFGCREESVTLSPDEKEHRRNLFWIAYCVDREISLRYGKPPTESDDEISVGLPSKSLSDSGQIIPSTNRHGEFNAFRAQCQLATIKSQLYRDLYSTTAKDRPLCEIVNSVWTLDEMLQNWREALPLEYQPDAQGLPIFPQSSVSVMLLYLNYSYFNCIIAMHRLIAIRGINTGEDLVNKKEISISAPLRHTSRSFMSVSLCANAARASIRLMRYLPEGHISLVGILIHYPIVALAALSSNLIRNPVDASRSSDVKLINQVETYLSSLVVSIPSEVMAQLKTYCANYRAAAEAAVQKTMQARGT